MLRNLPDVDTDTHPGQIDLSRVELLKLDREENGGACGFESQEAAISGEVDDPTGGLVSDPHKQRALSVEDLACALIPARRLECDGLDEISEDQVQDAGPRAFVRHATSCTARVDCPQSHVRENADLGDPSSLPRMISGGRF